MERLPPRRRERLVIRRPTNPLSRVQSAQSSVMRPLYLPFAATVSFQVFQAFAHLFGFAPNGHRRKHPSHGKGLVVNVANDICLRLEQNVSALNRTFYFTVHNHSSA
jgi:hypothetical protein